MTRPPHWWLGVPEVGPARPDLRPAPYLAASAAILLLCLWLLPRDAEATARLAGLPDPARPVDARPPGSTSPSPTVSADLAPGVAVPVSMALPGGEGGRRRSSRGSTATDAPGLLASSPLAAVGLDAVSGDRDLAAGLAVLGVQAGEAGGDVGFGRQPMVRTTDETVKVRELETTGTGYGVGGGRCGCRRGRTASVPQVRIGSPAEEDGPPDVRRYIRGQLEKIGYCYDKALVRHPDLEGTVSTRFTILADGTVADVVATGVDDEVAACIGGVIGAIRFHELDAPVEITYPFHLYST